MSSRLCIVLALAVLFGALAGGNPFLAGGPTPAAPSGSTGEGVALPAAAQSPRAQPVAAPAVAPGADGTALPATLLPATLPATLPACPEPALQPLVERVEFGGDGEAVWVLRDGRRVRRDPLPWDHEPAVVLVGAVPSGEGAAVTGR